MPQKIHAIYVLSPQISYDTKEQARTFDTLVLFVPYNEPYLLLIDDDDDDGDENIDEDDDNDTFEWEQTRSIFQVAVAPIVKEAEATPAELQHNTDDEES